MFKYLQKVYLNGTMVNRYTYKDHFSIADIFPSDNKGLNISNMKLINLKIVNANNKKTYTLDMPSLYSKYHELIGILNNSTKIVAKNSSDQNSTVVETLINQ